MRNRYSILPVILSIAVLFSACGKQDNTTTSQTDNQTTSQPDTSTTENPDTSSGKTGSPGPAGSEKEQGTEDDTDISSEQAEATEEPEQTNPPVDATLDSETVYSDNERRVGIIGFKSYKKLESKTYKDKAGKNKEYLVLFLEVINMLDEKDYINVNYLTAKVDGKKIKNTVLFNDPEGFQTIFQNIEPGNTLRGFIAWEVPDDWKNIEIKYSGWKDSDNLNINCRFTPDDYFDPPKYS